MSLMRMIMWFFISRENEKKKKLYQQKIEEERKLRVRYGNKWWKHRG